MLLKNTSNFESLIDIQFALIYEQNVQVGLHSKIS